jgi:beta-glucosidase
VARLRDYILNRAFFALIGTHPSRSAAARRSLDFIGINYYTRNIVRSAGLGLGAVIGRRCTGDHHDLGRASLLGWEIYPQGLVDTLERFAAYGLPLMVTENGVATDDEALRRRYLLEHLAASAEALARGVHLVGYLYWSLIDNFEWAAGTAATFGLAAVDYRTQERRARPCVADFTRVCRDNALDAAAYAALPEWR